MNELITIRLATLSDLPVLIHHRRAMFKDIREYDPAELDAHDAAFKLWVQEQMERGDYFTWLMANQDNRVVAGAAVWMKTMPPLPGETANRRAYILNVYTEPPYRRRGLATRLMRKILHWCEEQGIDGALLHASDAGRPLYESLGFVQTNEMRIRFEHT
jgi:GNAT superfamily N-acetyltransferase